MAKISLREYISLYPSGQNPSYAPYLWHRVLGLLACGCMSACHPHTLQQELAGADAAEIIIYASGNSHQDTLTLSDREWIRILINSLIEAQPPQPACEPQGKIIFWKKAANHQLLAAEWSLAQGCAYLRYQRVGKKQYARVSASGIILLQDLLQHRDIVREWQ